jgi:uncharacterized protein YciW
MKEELIKLLEGKDSKEAIEYIFENYELMPIKERDKCTEIFKLMQFAKMTLAEINTLTDNERATLAYWFEEHARKEHEYYKKQEQEMYKR